MLSPMDQGPNSLHAISMCVSSCTLPRLPLPIVFSLDGKFVWQLTKISNAFLKAMLSSSPFQALHLLTT